jgi:hypothetical protein
VATDGGDGMKYEIGSVHEFKHPFIREIHSEFDGEGIAEGLSWRPGVRMITRGPETSDPEADGIGTQILTVISVHKPGKYPERIFYTRRWRDPDGKEFGKGALRVRSAAQFSVLVAGYRHPVVLSDQRRPR